MSEERPYPWHWRRIRLARLRHLLYEAPQRLRWRWEKVYGKTGIVLALTSPRGVLWRFKLSGGAWIRKEKPHCENT